MEKISETQEKSEKIAKVAAMAAVALSLALVLAKSWAWMLGGSAALLASLVDSVIDALMSFTNYPAIRYAHRPADHDHRYGHGKAEGIAALAQAAFIAGSCVFVMLEAFRRMGMPASVESVELGVAVLVVATLATFALTRYQDYAARKSHSLAVEADAAHYTGDVAINFGVIASLLAGKIFGWHWIDPLAALLVAGWLLYSARAVGTKAIDMLLDRELDDSTRTNIIGIIKETQGVEGLHDLRTRRTGTRVHISFDLEVEPSLSMLCAHAIARTVEGRLLRVFPNAEVMIHIDPKGGDLSDSRHRDLLDFHER